MKIRYSEKIDREIFKEVNKMGKKLTLIFGFKFPKVRFDKRVILIAKTMSKVAPDFINENKMKNVMKKIYGRNVPEITVYINTTPFSSWGLVKNKKYLTISYGRNNESKFFSAVCHEANHFMYDYCFGTEKYQDTEVKETLTVLNNIFGIKDKGWDKFSKQREKILEFYNKTKDFKETINYTRNLFKK